MSKNKFGKAVRKMKKARVGAREQISGLLGIRQDGQYQVNVPGRNGYVYVRLRGNLSELIQAWNDQVSATYNLPVIVEWDRSNPTRYRVVSRDVGRYSDWGSPSPYLPHHGSSHSYNLDGGGGGDIVWVYPNQWTPLLAYPSGTSGAMSVSTFPFTYRWGDEFRYAGATGTPDLSAYKPTGTTARMILLYMQPSTTMLQYTVGDDFDAAITGSAAVLPYIPGLVSEYDVAIAGIRLVSGTQVIGWENLYDLRPYFEIKEPPASGTSDVTLTSQNDGWTGAGGVTTRTLTITGGDVTLNGGGSIDFGLSRSATFPAGTYTLAPRGLQNTFTRTQSIESSQEEVGLVVKKSAYQDTSDLQQWQDNASNPITRIGNDGYLYSSMTEVDAYDYPMSGLTGTYDHFRQNGASFPAGWTEVDGATGTSTSERYSYWTLKVTQADSTFRYRRHGLANLDSGTYVTDGNVGVYNFGPLLVGAGNGHKDVNYIFGMYKDNGGSINVDAYCRAHLWWDSANKLWKIRGEEADGGGGDYSTPDHTSAWRTLGAPLPQPLWISLRVHAHAGQADNLLSRVYAGSHPVLDTHELVMDVLPNSAAATYGTAWIEMEGSIGTGASGSSAWLRVGGYDFTQSEL